MMRSATVEARLPTAAFAVCAPDECRHFVRRRRAGFDGLDGRVSKPKHGGRNRFERDHDVRRNKGTLRAMNHCRTTLVFHVDLATRPRKNDETPPGLPPGGCHGRGDPSVPRSDRDGKIERLRQRRGNFGRLVTRAPDEGNSKSPQAHRRVQRLRPPTARPVEETTTKAKRVLSDPALDDRRPKSV